MKTKDKIVKRSLYIWIVSTSHMECSDILYVKALCPYDAIMTMIRMKNDTTLNYPFYDCKRLCKVGM